MPGIIENSTGKRKKNHVHSFLLLNSDAYIHKEVGKGNTLCMKCTKMRQISIPCNALVSRHNKQ